MRYELTDHEWAAIKPMLPNKPGGVPRVNDHRVLNGIFWVLRSGAAWRDLPEGFRSVHHLLQSFHSLAADRRLGKIMNALAGAMTRSSDERSVRPTRRSAGPHILTFSTRRRSILWDILRCSSWARAAAAVFTRWNGCGASSQASSGTASL